MSKLLFPVLCLCLAIWLFGGSYWFAQEYSINNATQQGWTITDGKEVFHSNTIFSFQYSDPEIILDDNQLALIGQLAEYLNTAQDRDLTITGNYTAKEINNSDYDDLGLARAESFRYLLYRQGVDLERLIVKSHLVSSHSNNNNGLIDGGVSFSFSDSPLKKYGADFSLKKKFGLQQDATLTDPNSFELYLAALKQYLVDYNDKKVQLTLAFHNPQSKQGVIQKRLNSIINDLESPGVEANRIKTKLIENHAGSSESNYIEVSVF